MNKSQIHGTPDFGIEIQFDSSNENPSKVFRTLSELLDSLQLLDEDLVGSIDSKIKPIIVLEDLQKGSVKGWFKNALEAIPDEGLKDLNWKKAVGTYLVKGKYLIINFLNGKTEITSRSDVQVLEAELFNLAKDTNVRQIPAYTPIPTATLIGNIQRITSALQYIDKSDHVIYSAVEQEEKTEFNLQFNIAPDSVKELLTKESITTKSVMILKIKKPDYLGESQWQLRHEREAIDANIVDIEWLKKFQERKINLRPGDSIRANVDVIVHYDFNNEVIAISHNVTKVIEVIEQQNSSQLDLDMNSENK